MAQSYFESEITVNFFQQRNNEMGVNKKTFNVPMTEKFLNAIKKTIKDVDKNHVI
ncbi:MAG: hypothetical protein UU85_C0004G0127 [Candidatus Wolfebacteria bacterium GW2011_GWA2_42_10]|uniref:Uncharacterized protein n=2 Tax=Candidatus Wolfeibacteriota TaxID=1752735 RepID=A0A0G1AJ96_9BACT|nr:MAG: hypothetical protein UU38_C0001G0188 [Candidatus Wolfebacteria bacterium GW2011_GWB1_41_12]KKS25368.1 MAG: hypothetical protein UU85_C0004G0127 [Candidatus Wolfebacteria bacterium GW2011_GWA2_42_10]KKT56807.1 MAG: hypothetical protein UW50_C0001G0376 [Candidatus Wolfebacteria bacterium GW2011_GWA1_44_24]